MNRKADILTLDRRRSQLLDWLTGVVPKFDGRLSPLSGDAGNRQYYRIMAVGQSFIAVDDAANEQRQRFIGVGERLRDAGVSVPAVFAVNEEAGFLWMEDFGNTLFLSEMNANVADAGNLYDCAIQALIKIQRAAMKGLPLYDDALLATEMSLFADWYCTRHLQNPLSATELKVMEKAMRWLQEAMRGQRRVLVHRDYHSRNLMILPDGRLPGVLDFQDAVVGSVVYDIVSLLRDAYVEWGESEQRQWLALYQRYARSAEIELPSDLDELWRDFNITGVQRGLKVLGIFARLAHRDNKSQFIGDMPVAYRHLLSACRQTPALCELAKIVAARPPI